MGGAESTTSTKTAPMRSFKKTQNFACVEIYKDKIILELKLNPDSEMVKIVKEGLERTGGYCPCRRERTEEFKCMCKEFKAQIADPTYEGFCHCRLYLKP